MPPRREIDGRALRAAKLSRVPGMTVRAAAERLGVGEAEVRRARRDARGATHVSLDDLVLAALTGNGVRASGRVPDLAGIAAWLDYVNHDGSTAEDVRRRLQALVGAGALRIAGDRWKLTRPWP